MMRGLPSFVLTLHHTPARWSLSPTATGVRCLKRLFAALSTEGYRFASMAECAPDGPPRDSILLTADDGYLSHARHLAPLLRELGIPWTVFVLAGSLGGRNRWDSPLVGPRERHLTGNEIAALAAEGVTIGSHGMTHRDFTRLDDETLAEELGRSRDVLRRISGQPVDLVSYPRGRVDARVARAARRAGFRLGFAAARAFRAEPDLTPLAIPRIALYAPDQIPGVFARTALRARGPLTALRPALARLGDALIVTALRIQGGRHV